jgi:hypothetical protein
MSLSDIFHVLLSFPFDAMILQTFSPNHLFKLSPFLEANQILGLSPRSFFEVESVPDNFGIAGSDHCADRVARYGDGPY